MPTDAPALRPSDRASDPDAPRRDHASDPEARRNGDAGADAGADERRDPERQDRNALEWVVFGLGLLITVGLIGFLIYQIAAGSDRPADLRVTLGTPQTSGETVLIPVEVVNRGDRVAEGAVVEVCAGPEACAELSFHYVPKGSTRQGVVGLAAPLAAPLDTRVVSYRTP